MIGIRAICLATAICFSGCASTAPEPSDDPVGVSATLRSASFVTHDLEASIAFYRDFLGYRVLGQSEITAEKSRKVVGAQTNGPVRYAAMAPKGAGSDFTKMPAGISLIEIPEAGVSPLANSPDRSSRVGEVVLAHRVTDIAEIDTRMRAAGVPIIAPLGPSGSGKSMSMAVLDPNGNRVELYEY